RRWHAGWQSAPPCGARESASPASIGWRVRASVPLQPAGRQQLLHRLQIVDRRIMLTVRDGDVEQIGDPQLDRIARVEVGIVVGYMMASHAKALPLVWSESG